MSQGDHHAHHLKAHLEGVDQGIDNALEKHNLDMLLVPGRSEMSVYAALASTYLLDFEEHVLNRTDRRQKPPTATVSLGMYGSGKPVQRQAY